jgi:predicted permease
MEPFVQELRQAARRLWRSPAFTLATILTLALAIGANGAIFAVVQRVVINPLPYPESDRLIAFDHAISKLRVSGTGTPAGLYLHYLDRSKTLEAGALYSAADQTVTGPGGPERIRVARATPSLGSVLQVRPLAGRWFTGEEGQRGAPAVAVLSHGLWMRRYGGNPGIIGRSIVIGGTAMDIVGVMPASFAFPDPRTEAWTVLQLSRADGFGLFDHTGIGRMRAGVTVEAVRTELDGLIADVPRVYADDPRAKGNVNMGLTFSGRPLKDVTLGTVTRTLWILLAAVGVVLLVACANVANLFLVRSEIRRREVAVRRALGAGRSALARLFLSESLLLSAGGGALALLIAWSALRLLVRLGPSRLPRLHETQMDATVIAYLVLLVAITTTVFAVVPLWQTEAAGNALQEQGRGNTATRQRHHVRHVLLGVEVALSLTLLVASGLTVRSFQRLRAVDPGFNPSSAATFSIGLPDREYPTIDAALAAHQTVIDRVSALPGVAAVAGTTCLPLSGGCFGNSVAVEGQDYPPDATRPVAVFRAITGGYLETAGTRLIRGRTIDRGDVDRREPVAVISETLAARAFGTQDPIGRRIASNQPPPRPGAPQPLRWLMVVGIVADTPIQTVTEPPIGHLYMPLSLARGADEPASRRIDPSATVLSYLVRTSTPPLDLVPAIRDAVQSFDGNLALAQVMSLQQLLDRASAQMAFTMVLLAIAAAVSLLLGVVGIYGVMAYIVSQRTSEIGVRLALGAEPGRIAGQIVRQGALVTLAGIMVGWGVALAGGRLIASVLYGVSPRDPVVFGVTATVLLAVALLACWVPARRAARLNPVNALRAD